MQPIGEMKRSRKRKIKTHIVANWLFAQTVHVVRSKTGVTETEMMEKLCSKLQTMEHYFILQLKDRASGQVCIFVHYNINNIRTHELIQRTQPF